MNIYSKADRATKYGLLFVALTFVGFFLFELLKRLPIHPIQYGLVGLALAIFFLLLVSLSEHIAFGSAYLIASAACIGLLGLYLSAVLRSRARGAGFAASWPSCMRALRFARLRGQRARAGHCTAVRQSRDPDARDPTRRLVPVGRRARGSGLRRRPPASLAESNCWCTAHRCGGSAEAVSSRSGSPPTSLRAA